jgi:hypothetical protein
MNPIGALILAVLLVLVLFAPRRWALLGMMAGVLFLTQGVALQIAGFNVFATRFLELAGFIRVMGRREFSFSTLNKVDKALIWLYGYSTIVFLLRSSAGQVFAIGVMVDAFLCYFTFRGLIGDMEDFQWFLRAFLFLLVPFTLLILWESFTKHNLFSALGGVPNGTWGRANRLRCFGSFRQPDTLGMFGASFLPLYIGLACIIRERKRALLGICLCLIIGWAANSGGAAAATAMGLLGWLFWRVRTEMRKVRWGIVSIIAALALVMKAPVWYIFTHVSAITGGDGWHRSYLIDVAWQHLGQWWLWGMPIKETSDWFPYTLGDQGQADITNQFIAFGLAAGLGGIVLFIYLLTWTFSRLGQALAGFRSGISANRETECLLWGLGVMLVVHIANWFGITYFDQMYVVWFMQLAAVSTLSEQRLRACDEIVKETLETEENPDLRHNKCSEFAL